jgi:hypothetical protein
MVNPKEKKNCQKKTYIKHSVTPSFIKISDLFYNPSGLLEIKIKK